MAWFSGLGACVNCVLLSLLPTLFQALPFTFLERCGIGTRSAQGRQNPGLCRPSGLKMASGFLIFLDHVQELWQPGEQLSPSQGGLGAFPDHMEAGLRLSLSYF